MPNGVVFDTTAKSSLSVERKPCNTAARSGERIHDASCRPVRNRTIDTHGASSAPANRIVPSYPGSAVATPANCTCLSRNSASLPLLTA